MEKKRWEKPRIEYIKYKREILTGCAKQATWFPPESPGDRGGCGTVDQLFS